MMFAAEKSKPQWLAKLLKLEADDLFFIALQVSLILLIGLVVGRLLGRLAGRLAERRGGAQARMIARRLVFYLVFGIATFMALEALGLDLSVLLGAAGILTVALGFASQTSASNLISGLFLLGERPFVVGDSIEVGKTSGIVLAVDLLSVKLRTFDNLYVRVPNETLIKSEIINYSRNPIRRIDIDLRVAYTEDLERVRSMLYALAEADPDILHEPEPIVWIDRLGESAVHIRFLVWASNQGGFFAVRSRMKESVARALIEQRVAIGYHKVEVDDDAAGAVAAKSLTEPSAP
jgi:small-conductance mechanosensitive channel